MLEVVCLICCLQITSDTKRKKCFNTNPTITVHKCNYYKCIYPLNQQRNWNNNSFSPMSMYASCSQIVANKIRQTLETNKMRKIFKQH